MTRQRVLLTLAIAAGLVAGTLYWVGAQRVSVVVASSDLRATRALAVADLEVRQMAPDALPADAVTDPRAAAGRYLRAPVFKGQLILSSALADAPAAFAGGIRLPTGYRAIAVPVDAARALGGAVQPGSRVDVIAVPTQGRPQTDRGTELLVSAALVIDVRGEQGGAFEQHAPTRPTTAARERLGSVVIAVGPAAELRIADRIGSSAFVLALVPDGP